MTDVAALVAEARDGLDNLAQWAARYAEQIPSGSTVKAEALANAVRWVEAVDAALATAGTSRPVRPPREARVARLVEVMHDAPYEPVMERQIEAFAGAVADADLWQFAPVMDRDALAAVIREQASGGQYQMPGDALPYEAWSLAMADALLPFIGQPASPRTVDRPEKPLREAMIDAGAFRNSPKRVVVKAVDQMLAAPDLWASPRTVTTVEELDALPVGSVIRINEERGGGLIFQRFEPGLWVRPGSRAGVAAITLLSFGGPASVLYVPSAGVATEPTGEEGVES